MSQSPPAHPTAPGARPADAPAVEPGFEVALLAIWERQRNTIFLVLAAMLLAILAWQGWQYVAFRHEQTVREEFAKTGSRADRLAAFAEANPGHILAGVAYLQLADQNFSAADYKQAAATYQKAAVVLKSDALLGRARLGAAISLLNSGDQAAGEAALKAVGADESLGKGVRAEATYHLASIACQAGRNDELAKLVAEVAKIDAAGSWSRRATMLLANIPVGERPADKTAPAIKFGPGG